MFQTFKKFGSENSLWFSSGVFITYPHGSNMFARFRDLDSRENQCVTSTSETPLD
jgi:hypothetical protein